ncbi:hypothetical protein GALMADRAFT_1131141 [Galerina marginata CBS 339.88]|uniref:Carbonic anhydrase n=1 Tax=Galerina marginata (strain CBS 339.88) TaxID=685588 RepID=A0A067SHI9_GALM3|nr:hypothetical protein GALMADRAFT_1131141 [Galerina marginata CBS 339.88]
MLQTGSTKKIPTRTSSLCSFRLVTRHLAIHRSGQFRNAVLSFAVETLKVKHVVVLGHYGCGGIAESMMPINGPLTRPADIAVQRWIQPIRQIYESSSRTEIVAHREACKHSPLTKLPDLHDPAFRAMVEENVKSNVRKVAESAVIQDHYTYVLEKNGNPATLENKTEHVAKVLIHGWVYDVETGKVSDLGVSVGPPGRRLPASPFPLV